MAPSPTPSAGMFWRMRRVPEEELAATRSDRVRAARARRSHKVKFENCAGGHEGDRQVGWHAHQAVSSTAACRCSDRRSKKLTLSDLAGNHSPWFSLRVEDGGRPRK